MKNFVRYLFICTIVLSTAAAAEAKAKPGAKPRQHAASSSSAGSTAAKIPLVIIGSAAKMTWATTKFTMNHVAGPIAKTIFVKATPAMAKFALRNGAKYLLPFATRLSML